LEGKWDKGETKVLIGRVDRRTSKHRKEGGKKEQ